MRRWKPLLFSLAATVFALALLEGGASLAMRALGYPRHRPAAPSNPFHPYLGWEHAPGIVLTKETGCGCPPSAILTGPDGRPVTPIAYPRPALLVVLTGGSSAAGIGASDNRHAVAGVLERLLSERLGIKAELVNLAVRGYQSFQEMLVLRKYLLEEKADMVIALSGRNDAHMGAMDPDIRFATLPPRSFAVAEEVRRLEQGKGHLNVLPALRSASAFADLMARMAEKGSGNGVWDKWNVRGEPRVFTEGVPRRVKIMAENFAMMDRLCKEHGAAFYMVLQPTAFSSRRVFSPEEMECLDLSSVKHTLLARYERAFYQRYLSSAPSYARLDLSTALDEGKGMLFVDNCHYSDLGSELLAEKILEFVSEEAKSRAAKNSGAGAR
jgi:hypothetical protein